MPFGWSPLCGFVLRLLDFNEVRSTVILMVLKCEFAFFAVLREFLFSDLFSDEAYIY